MWHGSEMSVPWSPAYDVYFAAINGKPASFLVDLNAEALPSHPLRLQVRLTLQHPRDDGLPDEAEFEALSALEDQLIDRLEAALDSHLAGRFLADGTMTLVFYVPASAEERLTALPHLAGDTGVYRVQWMTEPDPEWRFYKDFLFPDAWSQQAMSNRAVLRQLEGRGDLLSVPREIDHQALFSTEAVAVEAGAKLAARGFRVEAPRRRTEPGLEFSLAFHRRDALDGDKADAFSREVLELVEPLGGEYEGWGCALIVN